MTGQAYIVEALRVKYISNHSIVATTLANSTSWP